MAVEEVPTDVEATLRRLASLMAAFGHPYRMKILVSMYFSGRPRSPVELSDELSARLGTIAYHVRTLHDKELVELAGERRVRGAVQHFYALTDKGRAIVKWAIENG